MTRVRLAARWLSGRALLVLGGITAVVLFAHLLSFGGGVPLRYRELMDVAHVFGFAGLTFFLLPHALRFAKQRSVTAAGGVIACLVFVAVLAVASESAQVFVARDASLGDLARDAGGMLAGLLLFGACARGGLGRYMMIALAAASLLAVLWSPGRVLAAMAVAQYRMPLLIGFESSLDDLRYSRVNASLIRATAGAGWPLTGRILDVHALRGSAGVAFERLPRNWSAYNALSFVIAARDGVAGYATVRVHDSHHNSQFNDRFNRRIEIGPEPRRIRIPLAEIRSGPRGRALDLSRVEGVIVFVSADRSSGFVIDDLRLE